MVNLEQKKILNEMWKTAYGKALFAFLEEEYSKIGDIMSCQDEMEMKGRQHAIKLLKNLFSFLEEKKSTEKQKNQYV